MGPKEKIRLNALRILTLWKYLENLLNNLSRRFFLSCKLLRSLIENSFDYHMRGLQRQVASLLEKWFSQKGFFYCNF